MTIMAKNRSRDPDLVAESTTRQRRHRSRPDNGDGDDDRDTLVSNSVPGADQKPLVIELCVEVPKEQEVADPAEQVVQALSRSLQALGWRPTVVCARRIGRPGL